MLIWDYDGRGAWIAFSGVQNDAMPFPFRIEVLHNGDYRTLDTQFDSLADAKAFCEDREAELRCSANAEKGVTFNTGSAPTTTPGNVMYAKAESHRFNLNQKVRFKPTDEGGGIIYDMLSDVSSQHKARYGVLVHLLKDWSTDSDGYVTVGFWEFMQVFGPHMHYGNTAYFEDNAFEVLPMK